jgi:hypothetical protein
MTETRHEWLTDCRPADTYHLFTTPLPVSRCGIPFAASTLSAANAYIPLTEDMKCETCKGMFQ